MMTTFAADEILDKLHDLVGKPENFNLNTYKNRLAQLSSRPDAPIRSARPERNGYVLNPSFGELGESGPMKPGEGVDSFLIRNLSTVLRALESEGTRSSVVGAHRFSQGIFPLRETVLYDTGKTARMDGKPIVVLKAGEPSKSGIRYRSGTKVKALARFKNSDWLCQYPNGEYAYVDPNKILTSPVEPTPQEQTAAVYESPVERVQRAKEAVTRAQAKVEAAQSELEAAEQELASAKGAVVAWLDA